MSAFTPAVRSAAKARIALVGPPGSGKTYTALMWAHTLGDNIAVIDSERRAASGYVGVNGWAFDVANPASFEPESLVDLLADSAASGHDVVVVDSLSHYWMGVGGMLEQVDRKTTGNNSFGTGWKEARPAERRMVDALLSYPGHVIATMRTKVEYSVEKDDRGKNQVRKIGLKPEQRDGIDYEFRIVGSLTVDNSLTITKSSIPPLTGRTFDPPTAEVAQQIRDWFEVGEDQPDAMQILAKATDSKVTAQKLKELGEQAIRLGVGGAAVNDAAGNSVQLIDLIRGRFLDVRAVEMQAASETTPKTDEGKAA